MLSLTAKQAHHDFMQDCYRDEHFKCIITVHTKQQFLYIMFLTIIKCWMVISIWNLH